MLNEEQASDDELRAKFGDKWKRTESKKLTEPLRQGGARCSKIDTFVKFLSRTGKQAC